MKLYIAHVGFYDDEFGIYELHSNLFVAAEDPQSAKAVVKAKEIFIRKKMHIDGIQEISSIDGYDIKLVPSDNLVQNAKFDYDQIKSML